MIRWKRRPALVLALGGFALAACRLAAATPGTSFSAFAAARLRAGSNVSVSWTLSQSAAPDADEMELVLSLDDGATFPIRVTGRIAPGARSIDWRVPALPTEHARLALRAGRGEEVEDEELLDSSDPFAIDVPPGGAAEDLFPVNDEWRTREAIEGTPVRPLSYRLEAGSSPSNLEPLDLHAAELETGPAELSPPNSSGAPVPASVRNLSREVRLRETAFLASVPLRL